MKYIVLVGDGMADYSLKELKRRTPLEAAGIKNLNYFARAGTLGLIRTTPRGMTPGTDVANLAILGYDPQRYYSGRGPLEALNQGIRYGRQDIIFRCNLVTAANGKLIDYSAGHVTSEEGKELFRALNREIGTCSLKFFPGVSYRNLALLKKPAGLASLLSLRTHPPHDVMGKKFSVIFPKGKGAGMLIGLMERSREILETHPVNARRKRHGKGPANMIWLWGQGTRPEMPSFYRKYGLKGAVISAVDIVKGIGRATGMEIIDVPGATGYFDTDYEGKARYALKALKKNDLVFVHVEAPDEAGHNGDIKAKIKAIEDFDRKVAGTVLKGIGAYGNYKILALTDHPTPISLRTHAPDPVPFAIFKNGDNKRGKAGFNERDAKKSRLFFNKGHKLMEFFLKNTLTPALSPRGRGIR